MKKNFFVLFLILLFVPMTLFAQGYKVTPLLIDREVKQRDIFSETVRITNFKHHQITVYPSVNEVSVDDGGDITAFTPPSMSDRTNTITSWLAISRKGLEILPGETAELPLSVKIHPEAEAGIYHAFLGFGTGTNRPEAEARVRNGSAPGILLTLKVDQEKTEFMKLGRFYIERFVTRPDNTAVSYTLVNSGDAEVVPKGEIIFYNGLGEEVASIPVNEGGETLAPGQSSTFNVAAPTDGLLGKYKAMLSVDYGTEHLASVYDTAFFYVMPIQKLLIIFSVVLAVAIVLTVVLHRRFSQAAYVDDADEIFMTLRDTTSEEKEHDINLKKK